MHQLGRRGGSGAVLNLVGVGDNVVSAPQLYGATYTYFASCPPDLRG